MDMTDLQLKADWHCVNEQCERIVASVHGVIPLALANRRLALEDEMIERGIGPND